MTAWDDEEEYERYLRDERVRFARVLVQIGGWTRDDAEAAARSQYPYEPADKEQRGLIFHDEAWHWAMLTLYGEGYWRDRPELLTPPPELSPGGNVR